MGVAPSRVLTWARALLLMDPAAQHAVLPTVCTALAIAVTVLATKATAALTVQRLSTAPENLFLQIKPLSLLTCAASAVAMALLAWDAMESLLENPMTRAASAEEMDPSATMHAREQAVITASHLTTAAGVLTTALATSTHTLNVAPIC